MHNRDEQSKHNAARFPIGPTALAWANASFPCSRGTRGHAVVYAENAQGETIGTRDPGPWADVRMDGKWV